MSRKRSHSEISLGKAVENIEQWMDDDEGEEADNLHELYGEEDNIIDEEEDLNVTTVEVENDYDEDEELPVIRKRIIPKRKLTKNRLVNSTRALDGLRYARGLFGQSNHKVSHLFSSLAGHPIFSVTMSRDRYKFILIFPLFWAQKW